VSPASCVVSSRAEKWPQEVNNVAYENHIRRQFLKEFDRYCCRCGQVRRELKEGDTNDRHEEFLGDGDQIPLPVDHEANHFQACVRKGFRFLDDICPAESCEFSGGVTDFRPMKSWGKAAERVVRVEESNSGAVYANFTFSCDRVDNVASKV